MTLWEWAYFLNPIAGLLDSYRSVLFYGTDPHPIVFGIAILGTLVVGVIGMRTFWVQERDFAEFVR